MATREDLDAAIERYYDAWARADHQLFASLWAEGGSFADPPSDTESPVSGPSALRAHFDSVQGLFDRLSYEIHYVWRAGHVVAVHCTVTGHADDGGTELPLVHVFRFDDDARIQHLDAFIDHELARPTF